MVKKILETMKSKISLLGQFDNEISARKVKPSVFSIEENIDPNTLLEKYKQDLEREKEIEILNKLKSEYTRPEVLGQLAYECNQIGQALKDEANNIYLEAEKLKADYEAELRDMDKKFDVLQNKYFENISEYDKTIEALGFEQHEFKPDRHFLTSGARIIARQNISID